MHRKTPGIALIRTLGLSVSLLGVLLAFALPAAPSALAAGDVNQATCPNEANTGFTSALPDCRAYELVTPLYKGGFPFPFGNTVAGGTQVLEESLADVDGTTSNNCFLSALYESTRSSIGWSTTALEDVPLAELAYSKPTCDEVSVNSVGTSLLDLHPASHSKYEDDLYLRYSDGSLMEVGPMVPPSAIPPVSVEGPQGEGESLAGVTPDFSHILFNLHGPQDGLPFGIVSNLWPGDTTVLDTGLHALASSLYEYVGTGNSTPVLVGVDNAGKLISQCGTRLGAIAELSAEYEHANTHNAVSVDGGTVFFTSVGTDYDACGGAEPAVNELFARLNGSQTIAISEPSPNSECSEPSCTGAPLEDANFEGASEDGSKVFFTSTQKLLNGAVQGSENLYEYDFALPLDRRLVLVSGGDSSGVGPQVQGVGAVAEDGSHLYFVAQGVLTPVANGQGSTARPGEDNLYLFERDAQAPGGRTVFIATLSPQDAGQWRNIPEAPMDVTNDGRFLVFTSTDDLTLDDTSTAQQVFRYDASTNQLVRVSIGSDGFADNGNTSVNTARIPDQALDGPATASVYTHPAVSEDGIVVFSSSDGLTPQAIDDPTDQVNNAYEYREGQVYLISDGRDTGTEPAGGNDGATARSISQSGSDVFFETLDSLLPQDGDTLPDIYDAREGGGFPSSGAPAPCAGEACQGAQGPAPAFGVPGSATLTGSGNLALPPTAPTAKPKAKTKPRTSKCKRGQIRQGTKCIRKKAKAKKANSDRRAGR